MSKRILLILALVAIFAALAACAPAPTPVPTAAPPTAAPTAVPATKAPASSSSSSVASSSSSAAPTVAATTAPTAAPTIAPTVAATTAPTAAPTTAASSSASSSAASGTAIKFGIVLIGPYNDHGWSEANYIGAQYAKSKLPGSDFVYIDNAYSNPNTTLQQIVTNMVSQGVKVILTTSDAFQDDTIATAPKFPNITFINVSGDSAWKDGKNYKPIANLGNFMGKMEYMKMVAGCDAALSTQTGKIGFLGPLINDETRRLADSAYLGAKYCWTTYAKKNAADLKFDVTWIGNWFYIPGTTLDPTKVANDFYNSGHDVVISGIDTTEALVVAGQRQKQGQKVWAVSYDFKNGCDEAPDACLGVPYFNWGPRYVEQLKEVLAGTWKPAWYWDPPDWKDINNPDTGAVGFTFGKALTDANKTTLQQFIAGMGDGSINLFKGGLTLQDGTAYVASGTMPTDQQIWYLPQLLQGMTGQSTSK